MLGMKKHNGFTLVELMVTISIMAIVMALSAPSFMNMVQNNRMTMQINEFIGALNLARSEAVKRGVDIKLCRAKPGLTDCISDGTGNWEDGWIIFHDSDGDSTVDAGETVIRTYQAFEGTTTFRANNWYKNEITFNSTGRVSQNGTLVLCTDRNGDGDTSDADEYSLAKAVSILVTGRARYVNDPSSDGNISFTNCLG